MKFLDIYKAYGAYIYRYLKWFFSIIVVFFAALIYLERHQLLPYFIIWVIGGVISFSIGRRCAFRANKLPEEKSSDTD